MICQSKYALLGATLIAVLPLAGPAAAQTSPSGAFSLADAENRLRSLAYSPAPTMTDQLYAIDYIRLQGTWSDSVKQHSYTFTPAGPRELKLVISATATGEHLARALLRPRVGGMVGEFVVGPAHAAPDPRNSGEVGYSLDSNGGFYIVVSRGNLLGDTRETTGNSSRPQIKSAVALSADLQARWAGEWKTSRGLVAFKPERGGVFAYIPSRDDDPGDMLGRGRIGLSFRRGIDVGLIAGPTDAHGGWTQPASQGPAYRGDVVLRLSADGKHFAGYYTEVTRGGDQRIEWTGERVGAAADRPDQGSAPSPAAPPAAATSPPRPAPAAAPATVAEPTAASPAGDFQSLAKWNVRLDRVENPRDDRLTHVYLTLRNAGSTTILQTEGVWVYLQDSSGVEQRSGQGVQAQPGYPQLFGSPPPVVRPGKEIRTKFVFDRRQGASPLRVTVEEGGREAAFEF